MKTTCSNCKKRSELLWIDYGITKDPKRPQTIFVEQYRETGVIDIYFRCPHCNADEVSLQR